MNSSSEENLPDLEGRDDIKVVVDTFYEKVRKDDLLGFIFEEVASVNWKTHLPKMYDFWEMMIFRTGNYNGNPLRPHLDLGGKTEMGTAQFDRWKELFFATVETRFSGPHAEHLKNAAADMAQVMMAKISNVPREMTFPPGASRPSESS